jgi:hypothetical protein
MVLERRQVEPHALLGLFRYIGVSQPQQCDMTKFAAKYGILVRAYTLNYRSQSVAIAEQFNVSSYPLQTVPKC